MLLSPSDITLKLIKTTKTTDDGLYISWGISTLLLHYTPSDYKYNLHNITTNRYEICSSRASDILMFLHKKETSP